MTRTQQRWLGAILAAASIIALIIIIALVGVHDTWNDCVLNVFTAEHVSPLDGPSQSTELDALVKCGAGHGHITGYGTLTL